MNNFLRDLKRSSRILFREDPSTLWTSFRLWLGMKLLPKDFSNLVIIVISKLGMEYEKLETEKKDKICSLKVDFEYRE